MHVDAFVTQINTSVEKMAYLIIFENCDQDASTLCISKHVLQQFKTDFPHIHCM